MDDLERLFRQLVEVLATNQPERLTAAFQLSELYQSILPYRKYKRQLGFECNEDYEMAVLRLFAGEADYANVEPDEVREQLVLEAQATNPNPGAFHEFAAARVKLNEKAVRSVQSAARSFAPPPTEEQEQKPEQWAQFAPPLEDTIEDIPKPPVLEAVPQAPGKVASAPNPDPAALVQEPAEPIQAAPGCPGCGAHLPTHRSVQFCPLCGCQISPVPCPVCGDEIEVGWRFCVTCGRDGLEG